METYQVVSMLITGLSGAAGVAGAKFWFSKWINKTDAKMDTMQNTMGSMLVAIARLEEKFVGNERSHEMLESMIANNRIQKTDDRRHHS